MNTLVVFAVLLVVGSATADQHEQIKLLPYYAFHPTNTLVHPRNLLLPIYSRPHISAHQPQATLFHQTQIAPLPIVAPPAYQLKVADVHHTQVPVETARHVRLSFPVDKTGPGKTAESTNVTPLKYAGKPTVSKPVVPGSNVRHVLVKYDDNFSLEDFSFRRAVEHSEIKPLIYAVTKYVPKPVHHLVRAVNVPRTPVRYDDDLSDERFTLMRVVDHPKVKPVTHAAQTSVHKPVDHNVRAFHVQQTPVRYYDDDFSDEDYIFRRAEDSDESEEFLGVGFPYRSSNVPLSHFYKFDFDDSFEDDK